MHQEREKLFEDALRQKIHVNFFKEENTKLKTKIQILEGELTKKEKLVDDLLLQQDNGAFASSSGAVTSKSGKLKLESHLTINLKRKIKDLGNQLM